MSDTALKDRWAENSGGVRLLYAHRESGSASGLRGMLDHGHSSGWDIDETNWAGVHATIERGDPLDAAVFEFDSSDEAFTALREMRSRRPNIPVIVVRPDRDPALASRLGGEGIQVCLSAAGLSAEDLAQSIQGAIDQKRSELQLVLEERKYHDIFNNLVEGVFQTSADGRYLSANAALARIYGYETPDDLIDRIKDISRALYIHPERRAEVVRLMEANDVVSGFESEICRKDGTRIWISENCRSIRDSNGNLLCYEGTVEDITARKEAEGKLRDSEELYHSLVETLPQNIFRKDLEGRFTFVNHRFCKTVHRTAEEIIGLTDRDLFPVELATKYQEDDQRVLASGQVLDVVEEHVIAETGEHIFVQVIKTPLFDSQENIIGLQGLFWDITEKKRAEEQIRQANADLAASQEELRVRNDQMLADLAMARETQLAILPQQYPGFPAHVPPEQSRLHFCHLYEPTGAVGGDFFNVCPLSDTMAAVFICDVMGHGVRSALVTAMMRALVEELKELAYDPGKLLTRLNHDILTMLRSTGTPLLTTAFCLLVDLDAREMRYANAAHPRPFLLRRTTSEILDLGESRKQMGPALGLFPESAYETFSCSFAPRDTLMLFTDGLYEVEGEGGTMYDRDRLHGAVARHATLNTPELFDRLLGEIRQFSVHQRFEDDVCLLGVDILG